MNTTRLVIITLAASFLAGCTTPIRAPKGFITIKEPPGYDFKSVSARGNVFAMTSHDNDGGPDADLKFWTAAVEHHKVDLDGYRLSARDEIKTSSGLPGTLFDLRHGSGGGEYTYLIALFVTPQKVFTIEAGGPSTELAPDLPAIREAMTTLKPARF